MKGEFQVSVEMDILKNGRIVVAFPWIGEDPKQLFRDTDTIVQAWYDWVDEIEKKNPPKKKAKK